MTVTDKRNIFHPSHTFPLTPFSALRQKYYCFSAVPDIGISASGRARMLVPHLQKETHMAQKETGRLQELEGTQELWYIRTYRRFSQIKWYKYLLDRLVAVEFCFYA